jgi:RimJ/RimL family protein N-acetyltransferase
MLTRQTRLKNGHRATIRRAEVEDAAAVLAYMKEVAGETDYLAAGKDDIDWTVEKERQFIKDHADVDNKLLILAEIDGQIAGILGFAGDPRKRLRHSGELGMVVRRRNWGAGLGSALIAWAIAWARSSGVVRKIDLRVRVDNDRAIRLYEHIGFVREGIVTRQFALAGTFHDAYLMGLEIDP